MKGRKVGIAACGTTPFTRNDQRIESVSMKSIKSLFESNSRVQQDDIDAVLMSTNDNSKYLAQIISELAGVRPRIAHSIESLCNSGTNALVSAYSYIAAGLADTVLVTGSERYDSPGQVLGWDNSRGEFKHPTFWASLFTRSYKRRYGVSDEQLGVVPAKNHRQAKENPNAVSRRGYTVQQVVNSKRITDDLRLLDCSRSCTGSASILLASDDVIDKVTDTPVWITGIGQKTISAGFTKNTLFHCMESARLAGRSALDMAGRDAKDVDVAEVHDAFSVCEPMALESLGLCSPGKGLELVRELYETDNFKVNPRGGLLGSGHPLGATGVAQTIEIAEQLLSNAGDRQVDCARVGMVHNMAAAATSSTVLVLEA